MLLQNNYVMAARWHEEMTWTTSLWSTTKLWVQTGPWFEPQDALYYSSTADVFVGDFHQQVASML
jgi:hypothetical protein